MKKGLIMDRSDLIAKSQNDCYHETYVHVIESFKQHMVKDTDIDLTSMHMIFHTTLLNIASEFYQDYLERIPFKSKEGIQTCVEKMSESFVNHIEAIERVGNKRIKGLKE